MADVTNCLCLSGRFVCCSWVRDITGDLFAFKNVNYVEFYISSFIRVVVTNCNFFGSFFSVYNGPRPLGTIWDRSRNGWPTAELNSLLAKNRQ